MRETGLFPFFYIFKNKYVIGNFLTGLGYPGPKSPTEIGQGSRFMIAYAVLNFQVV